VRNELTILYRFYRDNHDPWGSAMGAFFDTVNEMSVRGLDIPSEFGYRQGAAGPYDRDEYVFADIADATDGELIGFASIMHRYTNLLCIRGLDY
jgi:hypothetical protein